MTQNELTRLRELASKIAEISTLNIHKETRENWRALNALKPNCPMFMIDQIPWHEMNVNNELTNQCEDSFCKSLETEMLRTLYRWNHLRADMVVEDYFSIPIPLEGATIKFADYDVLNYGIEINEEILSQGDGNDIVSHSFHDQLPDGESLHRLKNPSISINNSILDKRKSIAEKVFEGIMPYKMQAFDLGFQLWDFIVEYRGAEKCLYDLIDEPEHIHAILEKMTSISLYIVDEFERLGLIREHQEIVHCTGAYNYDKHIEEKGKNTNALNTWTFAMSQIFSSVSTEMHEEFEFPYLNEIFKRFGNVYYGCCEPLHNKIEMIRKYKNVRKISMSPWADINIGAENIASDFVLSRKPNPSFLAADSVNMDVILNEIKLTQKACKTNNTPVEYILKDISTLQGNPERLWNWEKEIRRLLK